MDKRYEKMVSENVLKLAFYNADRKTKYIIRCIVISKIMHPNFMYFRQKIRLSVLENFALVSGHLKIVAWKYNISLKTKNNSGKIYQH